MTPFLDYAVLFATYYVLVIFSTVSDAFTTMFLFSALQFPINFAGKLMDEIAQGVQICQSISQVLKLKINLYKNNKLAGFAHRHEIRYIDNDSVFLSMIDDTFTIGVSQLVKITAFTSSSQRNSTSLQNSRSLQNSSPQHLTAVHSKIVIHSVYQLFTVFDSSSQQNSSS